MASYFKVVLPYVEPAPEMTVLITPDRVANGRYLATHVAACMDCHSTRDWGRFSGPLAPGTLGKGGNILVQKWVFQENTSVKISLLHI